MEKLWRESAILELCLRRVRVRVKRIGVRVMPLSWREDSDEWKGLWWLRRILEINSASVWVEVGGGAEEKRRKRSVGV